MSSRKSDRDRPSEGNKCKCGSPHCWITYLSKLDKSLLPEIRVQRCGRCEPCLDKQKVILGGAPVHTEEYKEKGTPANNIYEHNEEPATVSPVDTSNTSQIEINPLSKFVNTETGGTSARSDDQHLPKTDTSRATEDSTSTTADCTSLQPHLLTPEQSHGLETAATDSVGEVSKPSEDIQSAVKEEAKLACTEYTLNPEEGKTQPDIIEINLKPFTVNTVNLDTGEVTVAERMDSKISKCTNFCPKREVKTYTMEYENRNLQQDDREVSSSRTRKMTIRTKILGPRSYQRNGTPFRDDPNHNSARVTPRIKSCSYQVKLSSRSAPRPRSTDYPTSKAVTLPTGSVTRTARKSVHSKCKQVTVDSGTNYSVDDVLSRSRTQQHGRGRTSSNTLNNLSRQNSNGSIADRPPWYPLRSSCRWDKEEESIVPVSNSALRRMRSSRMKAKPLEKLPTITPTHSTARSLYDNNSSINRYNKVPKRKGKTPFVDITKTSLTGIEPGIPVYCSFRGVRLPTSRGNKHESRRCLVTVNTTTDTPCECCSEDRYQQQRYKYDSDDTCYLSDTNGTYSCVSVNVASRKGNGKQYGGCRKCINDLQKDFETLSIHNGHCEDSNSNYCCNIPNCQKQVIDYDADYFGDSPTVVVHVCEYCAGLPDGSLCPSSTVYGQWSSPNKHISHVGSPSSSIGPYILFQ
ncbi:hypothetical protein BaOVIS_008100 [Babesia ovis]|uniref:Uncharacterized protein n=1 Tax=Babesia ovis TaxID=5869 RepID=A0A9W5T9T1_BABOV|nr:hypothetical protein BaOVIS_008100 [Babesia ovis]